MRVLLRWLLVLALLYPLGALTSCTALLTTYWLTDSITATESHYLLWKVRDGMAPEEVESIFGRPPDSQQKLKWCRRDYMGCFGCEGEECDVHFQWTVQGHETGVVFAQGRSARGRYVWRAPPEPPNAVGRFVRWFFFWWVPPLD